MNFYVKKDGDADSNIIPDYIRIKQNILDLWFTIQKEYQKYIQKRGFNLEYGTGQIFSLIKVLHFTNLRPYMEKSSHRKDASPKYKEFMEFMNNTKDKNINLNETDLTKVIGFLTDYLYELGLTRVDFDTKPFDQTFEDSYGG